MTFLRISLAFLSLSAFLIGQPLQLNAQTKTDPGAQIIAKLEGSLIYATNSGDPNKASKILKGSTREFIASQSKLEYKEYYQIGSDSSAVFRSYETWLQPIDNSETLMLSCEPKSIKDDGITFDINFWQNNKKIFSTVSKAGYDSPLIITGPAWRGGTLLYILELKK